MMKEMIEEKLYFVGGTLCRKVSETNIANVQVDVYCCVTFYYVFLNKQFAFEFKSEEKIVGDELVEFVLRSIINHWEVSDDVHVFIRKFFHTKAPNGNMMIQHERMMKCKKWIQELINQEWIDSIKILLVLS